MTHALFDGGPLALLLLAVGNGALLWGVWNLARGGSRTALTVQLGVALIPAALGAVGALLAYRAFGELSRAAGPVPKPAEVAARINAGLMCGLWGGGLTVLAAIPGVAALSRHAARWADRSAPAD